MPTYWRASGVRPRALPGCLADIGPADWNPLDDLVSEPDLRGFAEWYASRHNRDPLWLPHDAGTPGLRRRFVLHWLRRCQRWIKNELSELLPRLLPRPFNYSYHGIDSDKAARLRTLARRVELYCIAWRGDVEVVIRQNEAHTLSL